MVTILKSLKRFKKFYGYKVLIAALVVLLALSLFTDTFSFLKGDMPAGKVTKVDGLAKVHFYVMSQCPYGVQVLNEVIPVIKKFKDNVEFQIDYIANDNGDNSFSSLHGQNEVNEDIRQLCAKKISPDKYLDYILCQNKDARNVENNWQSCASESGIDVDELKSCFESDEGKQLLTESIQRSNEANAMGSPTMYFNDKPYNGQRTGTAFQRAICHAIPDHPECKNMPECETDADCNAEPDKIGKCVDNSCQYSDPVEFEVIVLNDKNCDSCDPTQINLVTSQLFKGVKFRNVDVNDDEGKQLVKELNLKFAPAYLFEDKVTETQTWKTNPRLHGAFEQIGNYYKLRDEQTGATHWIDPDAEAAYKKELAEKFKEVGVNLEDNIPSVNLMIMSQCPYGVQAFNAIAPVIKLLGDKVDFQVDYIANDNGDNSFSSLHGQNEVNEDIRQLCAKKISPDKYLDYILCQNKDPRNVENNWQSCASESGIDVDELKSCFESDEGKQLLANSIKISDLFGATGSPTLMLEGTKYQGDRTSAAYLNAICSLFTEKPSECDHVFEDSNEQAPVQGGCGA